MPKKESQSVSQRLMPVMNVLVSAFVIAIVILVAIPSVQDAKRRPYSPYMTDLVNSLDVAEVSDESDFDLLREEEEITIVTDDGIATISGPGRFKVMEAVEAHWPIPEAEIEDNDNIFLRGVPDNDG